MTDDESDKGETMSNTQAMAGFVNIANVRIPVWVVRVCNGSGCVFDSKESAEREAADLIDEENGDPDGYVSILEKEMTVKEFNELPEFGGY